MNVRIGSKRGQGNSLSASKGFTMSFWFLVTLTLVLGLTGWSSHAARLGLDAGDVVYRTIAALFFGGPYDTASLWESDWRLSVARLSGLLAFVIAASKAAMVLLSSHWVRRRAQRRSGHRVLVGDDALVERIARMALARGETVHRFCAPMGSSSDDTPGLFVVPGSWDLEQAKRYGLTRAASVIVSMRDEVATMAIARTIRGEVGEDEVPVRINIRSPWLVRRIGEQEKVIGIGLFSEARLGVRRIQRRHPPYLVARNLGHGRLHVVVVGFGLHGEAVMIETLLSSLVSYLDRPLLTIVDPNATAIRCDLAMKYPEIDKSVDIVPVDGTVQGGGGALSEEALHAIANPYPVTFAYICLPDDSVGLSAGLALQGLALRAGWTRGPIFVRLRASGAILQADPGTGSLEPAQLLGFGETEEVVAEIGAFGDEVDRLARLFHDGYREVAVGEGAAKVDWGDLTEDYRDSNRRLVLHMPAMVSSAGFDIEPWVRAIHANPDDPPLPSAGRHVAEPSRQETLAVLEHERWMADRRLNGWSYGATRDNELRKHPDLVPFAELCEPSKSYDLKMIEMLARCLEAAEDERAGRARAPDVPWWERH